ncbi:Fe(3+)-hydroxamate ABC transporter permease FhuB [Vibrio viridaestus]|uniref:Fe(3+)-hydroxamate ABC transporter permease FhuB n=1 Tax=Vibrio viridaestus TaxID=2487322 RepID=A0A3N9TE16_9VIBR|nr:Fe(3+)-hydroxamate ABC transporter permease FhuB [Vibrio viridaestus]RQW61755.1 Fe(3+)-hydroxamate ABC transporter permease FhuB [Vibrio viridaestus]
MNTRNILAGFGFILVAGMSLQIGQELPLAQQWHLLWSSQSAESFADFNFVYAQLPRLIMALCVGAVLGVVGSLMQQLTQNSLTSPLTLGTSSGAWLALVCVSVWWPDIAPDYSAFIAMAGALCAFGLIVLIAGFQNMTGLPIVIAGMVVNLLLGAIASAIILLNQQYAETVFMWGAGDLAQNGWDWFIWLWPKLLVGLLLFIFAPRLLILLRLGQEGASARGLPVVPTFFLLMLLGIWLVSASITAVGLIGFIGLITPNIARVLGGRTPRQELVLSAVIGAGMLVATDALSIWFTQMLGQVVPSGVTAAAIGAPALIWFSRRRFAAQDSLSIALPHSKSKLSLVGIGVFVLALLIVITLYVTHQPTETQWILSLPTEYQWQLRWPRGLTALSAGMGLAVAGVILQRLIYNPLASPDILGISSGATFMLVLSALFIADGFGAGQWMMAFLGSGAVLIILLILGKRHHFAPASFVLTGIALTALLQSFVQFSLAKGNQDSYRIMQWMAGSTYRVTPDQALWLFLLTIVLIGLALVSSRWLTLLSIGRSFSFSRGVNINRITVFLFTLVATLCAIVTATLGPVSFVGLIAPHLAQMMGAKKTLSQILVASLIGSVTLLWSDWLGQVVLFPNQIAAGTLVAIIGSVYFLALLIFNRIKA